MNVMVADTSVLVDLERGTFLKQCFRLPYQFTVPDLLFRNELANREEGPHLGEDLLALGLRIEELDGDEVDSALQYKQKRPALSLPDSFALALAASRNWMLLTGDGVLRALAQTLSVVCHGVLWVLDQIFNANVASPEELVLGLKAIRDHPRCRLPKAEISRRIETYSLRAK